MEENQTVPAMISEGDFAAFLEGEKVETLLSPLGYAYCAEDRSVSRAYISHESIAATVA